MTACSPRARIPPTMPFWTYFWLIVPAVTLLTVATVRYVRSGRDARRGEPR